MDFQKELDKYGLTMSEYKSCLKDIDAKLNNENDLDWGEIKDKYNLECNPDTIRKASSTIFGGHFRDLFNKYNSVDIDSDTDIDIKIKELRKERMKLQTLNLERNRLDRNEARQELYYEYIGETCNTLPLPDFKPCFEDNKTSNEYLLTIADIHYGASFESVNNIYCPEVATERFEYLCGYVIDFVKQHKINTLHIITLGDCIQGILRLSDLKINDSSVVKAVVEVSELIGQFLNTLSEYVNIQYYHTPTANHSQIRPLGSKASELADEDLEYVVSHYIKDLCRNNDRITVNLAEEGSQYLTMYINNTNIIACHGHTIKNTKNALKNLSFLYDNPFDVLLMGHLHGGAMSNVGEGVASDKELIIASSFVGSDPYADSLGVGSKSACQILGFNSVYGHTETYKIILN